MQQFSCKKQKQQLGVHFLLFKHLLLFGCEKKQPFFVHCYQSKQGQKEQQHRSGLTQLSQGATLWRGPGHAGSVPTAPSCPLSWAGHRGAGQNPPQVLSTSQRQNLGPVKAKISSPRIPWAEGVLSPWGGAGAEG